MLTKEMCFNSKSLKEIENFLSERFRWIYFNSLKFV
jgi:hypothetical protein